MDPDDSFAVDESLDDEKSFVDTATLESQLSRYDSFVPRKDHKT